MRFSTKSISAVLLNIACVLVIFSAGCEQQCVTKSDNVDLLFVWNSNYDSTCNPDGTLEVKESGDACIVASWDSDRTYDANGTLIRYDDHSSIWPAYDISSSKNEQGTRSSGEILLFFHFDTEAE